MSIRTGLPHRSLGLCLLPLVALAWACTPGDRADGGADWALESLAGPAPQGARIPNLFAAPDGSVLLSWFEPAPGPEGMYALRFSRLENGSSGGDANAPGSTGEAGEPAPGAASGPGGSASWSEPRTIVTRDDFFVNWADFPSVVALPDGRLAAHWLVRSGPDTYDYDIHLAWSEDGGERWGDPFLPHRDGTLSEHGFVSLFPWSEGSLGVVWLDGRHFAEGPDDPEMSLRFTTVTPDGPGEELLLDGRVCDCCQTSAALTDDGPIVVYRDRSDGEIRDISIVRWEANGWSVPAPVHRDGWEIPACPVNGPMVAAEGRRVVVAWFTAADDDPRVRLAFSDDAGRSFGPPISIDDGDPLGRVAVQLAADGGAVVSWLERVGDAAEVRVRRVAPDGARSPAAIVTRSSSARASGFPRMVRTEEGLLLAWTEVEAPGGIGVARLRELRP